MADLPTNVLPTLPLSVAMVAASGRVLFASDGLLRVRKAGPLDLSDVLPSEALRATALPNQVKHCIETGIEVGAKHVHCQAQGLQRMYRYSIFPLACAEQSAAAVVFEDVTDAAGLRRASFLGLRELSDDIVSHILAAIAVFTASGQVRFVNERFAQLVGQARASCLNMKLDGFPVLATIISQKAGSLADLVPALRSNAGTIKWQQVAWPVKDGTQQYYDLALSLLCTPGHEKEAERQEQLLFLVLTDTTDQVSAQAFEDRISQTEKLVAVGEMMAGLAHTINNPLSVISGNAQFLSSTFKDVPLDRLTPQDWQEIVACFISIEGESERCSGLIASLLQLSHCPQVGFEGGRTDINRLLADILRICESQFALDSLCIAKTFDSRNPQVAGAPDQIQQVFLNLITNARQSIPKGGKIEVTTEQKNGWVTVSVTDNGSGIKKGMLKRIFEPFFTTKPRGKGTGLGLSIANSIVTRCGGTIEVESEEGQGTTFVVRLPLAGAGVDELPLFERGGVG